MRPDGTASPSLARRVGHAAALAQADPDVDLFCSGGVGRYPPAEADLMAELLDGLVAPERVILDRESGDTLQTVRAAAALVRTRNYAECIACTDPYHQPRVRMLFALQGVRCRSLSFSDRGPSAIRRRMRWRETAAIPYDLIAGIGAAWQDRARHRPERYSMSLVELGRYSRIEAHIVVGRLASEGIDAVPFDGNASIVEGSWLLIPVRVMVDADDLNRAREILDTPA